MDLNQNMGPPLCPPPLSVDLGYDLALNDLPFPLSDIDDVLMRIPPVDAHEIPNPESIFESFDLPPHNNIPPTPSEERRTDDNALNSTPYPASLILDNEPLARTGGPTLQPELLEFPEYRFQRLFESRQRLEMARTRSNQQESDDGIHPATDPERLMHNIRRSGRLVGSIGKHKASEKALLLETSSDENKEKNGGASYFDCNICFEVATEPVVTCCGHLFCWPCLYQWLHVHCDYKECPVCKGKLNESSVVPIYGRGSSEASGAGKNAEDGDQGLKIPPRPQGNRVESLRQQLQGPFLRRPDAWLIAEMQNLFNGITPESFRFFQRGERRNPPTSPRNTPSIPPVTATSSLQTGTTSRQRNILHSSHEPRRTSRRREQPVTITLSDDLPDPAPSPSQASTSSTMAMIQGEIAVTESSLEPERGGTSMVLRRRTRSQSSGSSSANERVPQLRQRRRMN